MTHYLPSARSLLSKHCHHLPHHWSLTLWPTDIPINPFPGIPAPTGQRRHQATRLMGESPSHTVLCKPWNLHSIKRIYPTPIWSTWTTSPVCSAGTNYGGLPGSAHALEDLLPLLATLKSSLLAQRENFVGTPSCTHAIFTLMTSVYYYHSFSFFYFLGRRSNASTICTPTVTNAKGLWGPTWIQLVETEKWCCSYSEKEEGMFTACRIKKIHQLKTFELWRLFVQLMSLFNLAIRAE